MSQKTRKPNGAQAKIGGASIAADKIQEMIRLGVTQHTNGRLDAAEMLYRSALELSPDNTDAQHLLGVVLAQTSRAEEGIPLLLSALDGSKGRPDIAVNLARILASVGKPAEGEGVLRPLAEASPTPNVLLAWADCLRLLGRVSDAVAALEKAVLQAPSEVGIRLSLGTMLLELGRPDEAEVHYRAAVDADPRNPNALVNLGNLLFLIGRLGEARTFLHKADGLRFNQHVRRQYALACLNDGSPDEAIRLCKSIELFEPIGGAALVVLGDALAAKGAFQDAVEAYDRALALDGTHAEAMAKKALALLSLNDFRGGWAAYEARLRADRRIAAEMARFPLPAWDGGPVAGKRVVAVAEQGFGDTITFARFIRPLSDMGAEVVVACPGALARLFAGLDGAHEIVGLEHSVTADLMVPLGSLPYRLGVDETKIPGRRPYIRPDAALVARWAPEVATLPGLKVGLNLRLAGRHGFAARRSPAPSTLAPIFATKAVSFVDLSVETFDTPLPASHSFATEIEDFADTAAIIANLDLVVTVDTAIAHLSGSLGKETWLLVPTPAEWRWGQEGETCLWYPTVKVFRQANAGDWPEVIDRVAKALSERAT